jgi:sphingomyelin phosphodiesterase
VWILLTFDYRPDLNGILDFLVEALQATEDAGHRAWIIGHVAPRQADAMHDQVV